MVKPEAEHTLALLTADAVSKRWPRQATPVLDGVRLDVAAGETIALVGSNGAGKTTLLRILSGLIEPDAGTVIMPGHDATPTRNRRIYQSQIGLVSAGDRGLYARLSVAMHLDLWARLALIPRRERENAKRRVIADFALTGLETERVDRLSMGQRQRVRVALAFLHAPTLVLLDEPTNSLDRQGVDIVRRALAAHVGAGGGCIWAGPEGVAPVLANDRTLTLEAGGLKL